MIPGAGPFPPVSERGDSGEFPLFAIMTEHIFTYGSLMFDSVWRRVVQGIYEKSGARVFGYRRRRIHGEVYPAAIPGMCADGVDGIVYLNVSEEDLRRLDEFEGLCYRRQVTECQLPEGNTVRASFYVFRDEYSYLIADEDWDAEWFADEIGP